jgi:hypothetical protein
MIRRRRAPAPPAAAPAAGRLLCLLLFAAAALGASAEAGTPGEAAIRAPGELSADGAPPPVPPGRVLLLTTLMALASGLGALPYCFVGAPAAGPPSFLSLPPALTCPLR